VDDVRTYFKNTHDRYIFHAQLDRLNNFSRIRPALRGVSMQKFPALFIREQRCCHVTYWGGWRFALIKAKDSKDAKKKANESKDAKWADRIYIMSPDGKRILRKFEPNAVTMVLQLS